jgi:hypothetical protein
LVEDKILNQEKRWVLVKPKGNQSRCNLLLAKASKPEQESVIGNKTGGRVFLFLYTDDFDNDFNKYLQKGVVFVREPKYEVYGKVAVFKDLYRNLWDLIQPQ